MDMNDHTHPHIHTHRFSLGEIYTCAAHKHSTHFTNAVSRNNLYVSRNNLEMYTVHTHTHTHTPVHTIDVFLSGNILHIYTAHLLVSDLDAGGTVYLIERKT